MNPSIRQSQTDERNKLSFIQAGRGIAALLVVLFHVSTTIFAKTKYWGQDPMHSFFNFGRAGVEFFFVLSGFIIFYVHYADIGKQKRIWLYLRKRFFRVYPLYWIILFVCLPIYFLVPTFGKGYERDIRVIVSSLFLVPIGTTDTIVPTAWTLYHEILFYVVFSLMIFRRTVGVWTLIFWWAGCFLVLLCGDGWGLSGGGNAVPKFIFSPYHLLFGMGCLSYFIVRSIKIRFEKLLLLCGIVFFFAVGMENNYINTLPVQMRSMMYGLAGMMILIGGIQMEREDRIVIPKFFQLMGDASYSIYLSHVITLSFLAKVIVSMGLKDCISDYILYFTIVSAGVGGGLLLHTQVERPLLRKVRALIKRPA